MSYNPLPQPATSVVLTGVGTNPVSFANPFPVSLGSSSITIVGDITIPGTISVASTPGNPVHTHITEVGTSDMLTVPYLPVGITSINNGVSIGNTGTIPITIIKNGLPISDLVALPTRVLNDEGLIAYSRGAPVTEHDVLSAFIIDKSGETSGVGTSPQTMTTVWGANGLYPWEAYTYPGDKLYVRTLVNDPKIQGKSLTFEGLDANYNSIIGIVTFNASDTTIPVVTSQNFYRINRMYLTGINTSSLPHDNDVIVSYGSSTGTTVGKLTAPWGRGQNCFYTVPAGYEAFLLSITGNSGKDDEITSSFWSRIPNGTWELRLSFKFISGLYDHNMRTPLRIPEKSDVEIRAFALVEASSIGTSFQLLVIPTR